MNNIFLNYKKKGKVLSFPFSLLIVKGLFFNALLGQFLLEDFIHNNQHVNDLKKSKNYFQILNDYHIGLVKSNDSLNISDNSYGFKYSKLLNDNQFIFIIIEHNTIIKVLENDFQFLLDQKYHKVSLDYFFKRRTFDIDFNFSKQTTIRGLSYSFLINKYFANSFKISMAKSIKSEPFSLFATYTDFSYNLDNLFLEYSDLKYLFSYKNHKYFFECVFKDSYWKIKPYNYSEYDKIVINYEDDDKSLLKELSVNGFISFNENNAINIKYLNQVFGSSIDFKNSPNYFFKINRFSNVMDDILLVYDFSISNFKYNLAFRNKKFEFENSNRLRASGINPDFESLILNFAGASSYLNNQNSGDINQNIFSFSINFPEIKSVLGSSLQVDWIKDRSNISIDSQGYAFIQRIFTDERRYIITKEALNFKIGFEIHNESWLFALDFSQHFPYEAVFIDALSSVIESNIDDALSESNQLIEDEKSKNEFYGGGLININFIKYLD